MTKIVEITGLDKNIAFYVCAKCQTKLWGDHGWVLDDGSVVCRTEDKCHQKVIANKIKQEKDAGTWNPPWRRK